MLVFLFFHTGVIVLDLCGYENFGYEFGSFDNTSQLGADLDSLTTVRRYILPLNVDEKVALFAHMYVIQFGINLCTPLACNC